MSTAINRPYEVNAKTYDIVMLVMENDKECIIFFLMEIWVHVSVLSPCNLW